MIVALACIIRNMKRIFCKFIAGIWANLRGFKTRVCRRDFWIFHALLFVYAGVVGFLSLPVFELIYGYIPDEGSPEDERINAVIMLLIGILGQILSLLSCLGRQHDVGKHQWCVPLLVVLTILTTIGLTKIGWIGIWLGYPPQIAIYAYLGFSRSENGPNKWGDKPT